MEKKIRIVREIWAEKGRSQNGLAASINLFKKKSRMFDERKSVVDKYYSDLKPLDINPNSLYQKVDNKALEAFYKRYITKNLFLKSNPLSEEAQGILLRLTDKAVAPENKDPLTRRARLLAAAALQTLEAASPAMASNPAMAAAKPQGKAAS